MIFSALLDPFIFLPTLGLSGLSLFLLASNAPHLLLSQASFFILGILLFIFVSKIDYQVLPKLIWPIYIVSLLFLGLSFFAPEVRGAHRWIYLGNIGLQPSELIKPFMIIVFAHLLSRQPGGLSYFMKPILFLLPIIFMIFKQPDLGNALVFIAIFISLEIMAGLPWRYVIGSGVIFLILLPFSWHILASYQQQRIISFINPQADPKGAGYNALQAMIAIGSGQLFGLGLGKGTQSRLLFLPEYHTDFVFAEVAESLGFFGAVLLLLFYLLLLVKIIRIGIGGSDEYSRLLCVGVFSQFFIQIFINVGMNLGILPITGITLPLVSYGGSSIISTFVALGLVKAVEVKNKRNPLVVR